MRFPSWPRGWQSRRSFPEGAASRSCKIRSRQREFNLYANGHASVDRLHDEHEDEAGDGGGKGDPLVVVLEAGPPPGRLCVARVEAREVHQAVGSQEEVRGKNTF